MEQLPTTTRQSISNSMGGRDAVAASQNVVALRFDPWSVSLEVLDQTQLPGQVIYVEIEDCKGGFDVIRQMQVRGAPCIAAVACLSLVVELNHSKSEVPSEGPAFISWLGARCEYLISSRPTAVNLRHALHRLLQLAAAKLNQLDQKVPAVVRALTDICQVAVEAGAELNRCLGEHGASELWRRAAPERRKEGLSLLTHCNTGALATVGHGTALGVVRSLHGRPGGLARVYCTETRPYNQGSRLTAWELVSESIPATLIADSMVAYLMASRSIDAVLVGADCVAANGDTANKIGTLQIAVLAKHYRVPFYVAAPTQSVALETRDRLGIEIEERPGDELRRLGRIKLAPDAVEVWNPCFDVTPASLITGGIISELGVCQPAQLAAFIAGNRSGQPAEGLLF